MENQYQNYQEMVVNVNSGLERMETICGQLGMEEKQKSLAAARRKMASHKFAVGILGEFKRGKSTVINSLLEKEIVPADVVPTSATMNRITYDLTPHAEVIMKNGSVRNIQVDQLSDYVTKLDEEKEATAANVEEAVVYYPCKFCQNGVDIIDTPGLNDDERMNKVTEETIPKLDAVIMVLVAGSPFSMSEAEFVRNKIMSSDLGKVIFLVNKMDMVRREADKQRLLEEIKRKIRETVLDKMEEIYGRDSKEYSNVEMKLGKIRVYPFSALDALEGKMNGDQDMIQKSGTVEFEQALTRMLTEERGALELYAPLSLLAAAVSETAQVAQTRKNALDLSLKEFEEEQGKALATISSIRASKKDEVKRLRQQITVLSGEMKQEVSGFYDRLGEKLNQTIDQYPIDLNKMATEAGKKQISSQMSEAVYGQIQQEMCNLTEKVQTRVQESLNENAGRLSVKALEESAALTAVLPGSMEDSPNRGMSNFVKDVAIDVVTDYAGIAVLSGMPIIGVGGALAGYRAAGVKGLMVGGGVGAVASFLAITACPVVGIPCAIISCAAGTAAGKFAVGKLFHKDLEAKEASHIRSNIKKTVKNYVDERRTDHTLEDWIDNLVTFQFNQLIAVFEEESNRMLEDTEHTIDEIKKDLTTNEVARKQKFAEYDNIITSAANLWKSLEPTHEKIRMVLKGGTADA